MYSIGASIFACLAGAPPQSGDQRLEKDRYVSATRLWQGKYSVEMLETIDWCLDLDPLKRPQSVFALQKVLVGDKLPDIDRRTGLVHGLRKRLLRLARR